ncbi:DUF1641 domain-containing protein [Alicyclobacillus sp. ALC3]|uniref:DUF1641 domain-containing protein n=1 Tax=Alicyclobacillus sp. ALC3 TaxID=2796143 RepID=UPI002377F8B2|nr:DUF1641 domain-containing protein [Alicyclobacillus sp. ALC3]WDL95883.1 DUF1641 domain-containing protein [Alicyclobacillus sp. ALC3]
MARATMEIAKPEVTPEEARAHVLARIEEALAKHEGGFVQWLELMDELHEKGLLDIVTALLRRGDRVLEIVVRVAEEPGGLALIKNAIALVQGMGQLDTQALGDLFGKVNAGLRGMTASDRPEVTGAWSVMQAMRDPDVSRGLSLAFGFLKGLGQAAGGENGVGSGA